MEVRFVQTIAHDGSGAESLLACQPSEGICLSFANTLAWRGGASPAESLGDFAGLLAWAATHLALPEPLAGKLESWARQHPCQAAEALADAIGLREAVHGIASALACGEPAHASDLALLNGALSQAPARRRLARSGARYAWQIELGSIDGAGLPIPVLLTPVVWSAADLMVRGGPRGIRQCANSECLWLFIDESKNGTRRWCDMASCGNRAKARRHYLKMKQS